MTKAGPFIFLVLAAVGLIALTTVSFADKKEIRVPVPAANISLDPTAVQDQSSLWVSRHVNCQLVRREQGSVVPEAAKSYHFKDSRTLVMKLSGDAVFHDGTRVQAQDVVATFEQLQSSRGVLRNVFFWVKRVQAVDESTVVFHLKRPFPNFLRVLSAPNYALFKSAFIKESRRHPEFWQSPLGCGKYRVEERNEASIRLAPLRENLPKITFVFTRPGHVWSAEELKEFDIVMGNVAPTDWAPRDFKKIRIFDPYLIFLGVNTKLPRWKTTEARCALFKSLDSSTVLKAYGREMEKATDVLPRGVLGFDSSANYAAELASKNTKPLGLNGKPLCVAFLTVSVPETMHATYQTLFARTGAKIRTQMIRDPRKYGQSFQASGCDVFAMGLKASYLDGYEYHLVFSEKDANFSGYHDKRLVKQINDSQDIEDAAQRADYYQQISKEIRNKCLLYPIGTLPLKTVWVNNRIQTPNIGKVPLNDYFIGEAK